MATSHPSPAAAVVLVQASVIIIAFMGVRATAQMSSSSDHTVPHQRHLRATSLEVTLNNKTECGFPDRACCPFPYLAGQCAAKGLCNSGMTCNSDFICKPSCGGLGQPCCGGAAACSNTLQCVHSATNGNICVQKCGGQREACCPDNKCNPGFECHRGKCKKCEGERRRMSCCTNSPSDVCGAIGQKCCANNRCVAGAFCNAGTTTCTEFCGSEGQVCCPPGTSGVSADGCGSSLYCNNNSLIYGNRPICMYDCGYAGQQCCNQGWCATGHTCENGQCQLQDVCGDVGTPCCVSRSQTGTSVTYASMDSGCGPEMYCKEGICRNDCGKPGQVCCMDGAAVKMSDGSRTFTLPTTNPPTYNKCSTGTCYTLNPGTNDLMYPLVPLTAAGVYGKCA